uniref:Condensin complex subunit 1 C-terminal domain-containing protein n=1 Tax=Arion vulgaris TaxID=1028688 RepID=A0A0B7B2K0_9EUPU
MFLAEIAKTPVKMKHDLVISHWKTVMQSVCDDAVCSKWNYVLAVLGSIAKSIPVESTCDILDDLKSRLSQFSYPPPLIAGIVNCVSKLHCCLDVASSQEQMQTWGEKLMADCDRYISGVVLNNQNENVDEEQLIKYIFTLGEVCQRCPTRMPKRAALLIQSIVASPCIGSISNSGDDGNQYNDVIRSGHLERAEASHGSQPGSKETSHDSQDGDSQPDSYTSQSHTVISSQPLSQFRGSKMSSKLRAHAFITLGKLCLVDESLAKKAIAALARELEESDSPAVRNNVVIIMGDLTIRYTTLVDRYVTNIAACLKDPSPLVRKNTLTILTRLLQEEYVKWKGVLFFRYITTILDNAVEIKNLAEFCLEHLLLQKHPSMFFHPFLECIFHFNNYQVHTVYNKFKQTEREKQKFSLAGRENVRRRLYLYSFMLEHMTDEQRFKITDKINKEILSAVADQMIPLDNEGSQILHDALAILSSKEIKLSTLRSKSVEDIGGEEGADMAQIVTVTAKKALISQVIKRNVIENVVPVVISLKHMLEKSRSPLLKYLMMYLRELFKDYKNEIKDSVG